jgi:hypothetical protein
VKIGDMIQLGNGPVGHYGLASHAVVLVKKSPRSDYLEYDWIAFASGRFIKLGRQIEGSCEVISYA